MSDARRRDAGGELVAGEARRPMVRIARRHWAVQPPSTATSAPVTKLAASEARNAITSATSSGRPIRPMGCASPKPASISRPLSTTPSRMSVSITPGSTALARMPRLPPSIASTRVICAIAPFDAAYATSISKATTDETDATVTIEPPSMTLNASRECRKLPRALVARIASNSSALVSVTSLLSIRPALLTRTSRRPKRSPRQRDGVGRNLLVGHVAHDRRDIVGGELVHRARAIGGDHLRAPLAQQPRGRATDSASGARDHRDTAGEVVLTGHRHHASLVRFRAGYAAGWVGPRLPRVRARTAAIDPRPCLILPSRALGNTSRASSASAG
jgi:hypothetical protein